MTAPKTPDLAIMEQELAALRGFCPLFRAKLVQLARTNIMTGNLELVRTRAEDVTEAFRTAKESIADHCVDCAKISEHRPQGIVSPVDGNPNMGFPTIDILTSQSTITENANKF